MAVKVVSDKPVRTKKTICSKCWYELEYTPVDVKEESYNGYGDYGSTDEFIMCPNCNHRHVLKSY